jgi:hypothetical protein
MLNDKNRMLVMVSGLTLASSLVGSMFPNEARALAMTPTFTFISASQITDPSYSLKNDSCNTRSALQLDGNVVGLPAVSGGASSIIADRNVTSCIAANFDDAQRPDSIAISYRSAPTQVCGDSCSGDACGTGPNVEVFRSSKSSAEMAVISSAAAPSTLEGGVSLLFSK